jgi:leucyl-tRNA synthetase
MEKDYKDAFYYEKRKIYCRSRSEKMSKSKYNVVTPDNICAEYDRYVAFVRNVLGPLEQAKPWNTAGFRGVLVS